MTGENRVPLLLGGNLRVDDVTYIVAELTPNGCIAMSSGRPSRHFTYDQMTAGAAVCPDGTLAEIDPAPFWVWWAVTPDARSAALEKWEICQELLTGYKRGSAECARPDEPDAELTAAPSLRAKAEIVARRLTIARRQDAERQRALADEEGQRDVDVGTSTVLGWVTKVNKGATVVDLIDGRSLRRALPHGDLDPRYVELVREVIAGRVDASARTAANIRITVSQLLERRGLRGVVPEPGMTRFYELFTELSKGKGKTAKQRQSVGRRIDSTFGKIAAQTPGQIVAIDVTRADNMAINPLNGQPHSVEIITAFDVCNRVIYAQRVVPISANSFEAGLIVYDVLRPFSMLVEGTATSDWRWVGVPAAIRLDTDVLTYSSMRDKATIIAGFQGEHQIPGIVPTAISADNGSIFTSAYFRSLCARMGISLLYNRPGTPTDNAHEERMQGSISTTYMQLLPNYKGSTVIDRGRTRHIASEPWGTAYEIQCALRRAIAIGYHRTPHSGIRIPGVEGAHITPLEAFDAGMAVRGRIDLPSDPNLLYDFLPTKWLGIRQDGVEGAMNLNYNDDVLKPYQFAPKGTFRNGDGKALFMFDPNDLRCLYFREPAGLGDPRVVHRIPLADEALNDAPLTAKAFAKVTQRLRERGGDLDFARSVKEEYAITFDGCVAGTLTDDSIHTQFSRAAMRNDQSARDHAEARAMARNRELDDAEPRGAEQGAATTKVARVIDVAGASRSHLAAASWSDESWSVA